MDEPPYRLVGILDNGFRYGVAGLFGVYKQFGSGAVSVVRVAQIRIRSWIRDLRLQCFENEGKMLKLKC